MYTIKQVNIQQQPICFDYEMSPEQLKTLFMSSTNVCTFLNFLGKQTFEEI